VNRHVVFGTGQVGRHVVAHLVELGHDVVAVNRGGRGEFPGASVVGGDVTDDVFAKDVTRDASTVYFCLNASNYHRWPQEFPPLQDAVVAAASAAGARLVALENLYAYGPTGGAPMTEATPSRPENEKGATRAAMSQKLLDAHARGDVEVVIGRAADLVGPGVTESAMGAFVFGPILAGKKAQTMGRPDTAHSYSYAPDVGRDLLLLGSRSDAYGCAWHLPNPETLTTRQVITRVFEAAGATPRITTLKRQMLRALGLFNRNVRELLHTYYQFDAPFVVDDSAFRATFGGVITGWDEIIDTTLAYYRRSVTTVT
jgi:nucleoside-diphosphate-sugar epimerase